MLKFFTRLEKTRNFVLLLFAIVMVASLIFFYAPTRGDLNANLARSQETAATVSGEDITVGELYRQREAYSRAMQGQPYPATMMLNGMISNRIIRVEAERLGLTATDAEVAAAIREQFKPQDGKPFDQQLYERNVTEQFGSVAEFEDNVRDELSGNKLQAFLSSGVTVSEEEILDEFKRKNTKFDLNYVLVNTADIAKSVTPSDQELRDYFEKNKASYYISVPQTKIRYVFINTSKIGEKLSIPEADLRAEYDKLPADKKKAGVQGQEIVLRVAKPELEPQVLQKANELIAQLRQGETVSEEKFGELARGFSENAATAANGGALRGPVRENPNNPTDPYQRLIAMEPGEITEPINYQGRYFILRRGNDVPKSFEEARKELEVSLRNRRAYAVAAELAQKVSETLKQNKDVQATAQQYAAQANMSPSEMVRETGYVKPGDNVENIGTSPQFEEGIAPLQNVSDVGERTPIKDGFAIPMLVDRKEPRDAEFDEVKERITEIVKLEKARQQVEEIANQIATGAANASALAAAAQSKNLKVQDQKGFILGSPVGQGTTAGSTDELQDAVFALGEGGVTKKPIKIGENYYVIGVTKRQDANMDEFAKERDSLLRQKLTQKRNEIFQDYVAATRRKLESEGRIKIYKDAVAKIEQSGVSVEDITQQP